MSSQARLAANRANGKKSRGPRTAAGKSRASRNAVRHGLTTIHRNNPAYLTKIERLARIYCEDDDDPFLLEQALIIAECDVILMCVRAKRMNVFERIRRDWSSTSKSRFARARERARKHAELLEAMAKMGLATPMAQSKGAASPVAEQKKTGTPAQDASDMATTDPDKQVREPQSPVQVDEVDAMEEMLSDLHQFERYENRAICRRDQAVREFTWIRSLREFQMQSQKPQPQS